MTEAEMKVLHDRAQRLTKLLDDPHEGLFTWYAAVNTSMCDLQFALCAVGMTPEVCGVKE